MKMKILATTCQASGTGHLTETAQIGQGLHTFCLSNNIFDTNSEEELAKLKKYLVAEKLRAVIFENCWLPGKIPGISHKQFAFAKKLHDLGIESFFLCRGDDPNGNLGCELWRAYKPIKYPDMDEPALHTARIGTFLGSEVFDMKTGKVYSTTGGDSGWDQVQHAVRNYLAFHERNWPKIVETIKKELAL